MKKLALLAIAAAVVLAALLLLSRLPGSVEPPPPTTTTRSLVYVLQLDAGEGGSLLVNGSAVSGSIVSGKPFAAVIEAAPNRCYTLKQLLVNGTPVESSKLVLRVAGNTTVGAVFERLVFPVRVEANASSVLVSVNGSQYLSPVEFSAACGSRLSIELSAPRGFQLRQLLVNGSPVNSSSFEVEVSGSLVVSALLERLLCPLNLYSSVPAEITVNFTRLVAPAEVELKCGSLVLVHAQEFLRLNSTHVALFDHFYLSGGAAALAESGEVRLNKSSLTLLVREPAALEAFYAVVLAPEHGRVRSMRVKLWGEELLITAGCPTCVETPFDPVIKGDELILSYGAYFITLPEDWVRVRVHIWSKTWAAADLVIMNPPWHPYVYGVGAWNIGGDVPYIVVEFTRNPFTCAIVYAQLPEGSSWGEGPPYPCNGGIGSPTSTRGLPVAVPMRTISLGVMGTATVKLEIEKSSSPGG